MSIQEAIDHLSLLDPAAAKDAEQEWEDMVESRDDFESMYEEKCDDYDSMEEERDELYSTLENIMHDAKEALK